MVTAWKLEFRLFNRKFDAMLLVENREIFIPHLLLKPLLYLKPKKSKQNWARIHSQNCNYFKPLPNSIGD